MMDRRRFLLTSLAGALTAPLAVKGQQVPRAYRVGVLSPGSAPPGHSMRSWTASATSATLKERLSPSSGGSPKARMSALPRWPGNSWVSTST